ncbi:MAG: phosphatase PAP2 family protein, partial [Acidobacteriaceae bacterium]|nr:phosphatase PAP2 family protein [Acidobacteriaceae bacterium]
MIRRLRQLGLRRSEWVCVAFFFYIAGLAPFFPNRPMLRFQPFLVALAVFAFLLIMLRLEVGKWAQIINHFRDWLPTALTLTAFQEMELFLPRRFPHHYEAIWIKQDYTLLQTWHLQKAVESLGAVIPFYLEFCYLLVYGFPFYCVGILYSRGLRKFVDIFFVIYLAGTLGAYALFPFFPSQPPRLLYPDVAMPHITSWVRHFNLFILSKATIHVGVFPSAHVSSAFSAAWAMFLIQPRKKVLGWALTLYAVSVSAATIYGRYHYTADVLAGIGVSVVTGLLCTVTLQR